MKTSKHGGRSKNAKNHLNLRWQQNITMYIHRLLNIKLMVNINQKSIMDMNKERESKPDNNKDGHQITSEESKRIKEYNYKITCC